MKYFYDYERKWQKEKQHQRHRAKKPFHVSCAHKLCCYFSFLLSVGAFLFFVAVFKRPIARCAFFDSFFALFTVHLNSYRIVNKTWISFKWRHKIAYYFPSRLILLFYKLYFITYSMFQLIQPFFSFELLLSSIRVIHLTCRQNINFDTNKETYKYQAHHIQTGDFWLHVATHFYFVWPYYRIKYLNKSQYSYILLLFSFHWFFFLRCGGMPNECIICRQAIKQ